MLNRCRLFLPLIVGALLVAGCGSSGQNLPDTPPDIVTVRPASGGVGGGTHITLKGLNLANDAVGQFALTVGGREATRIEVENATTVTCITPPGTTGAADVVLVNAHGTCTLESAFTYHPAPTITQITPDWGTRSGGVMVMISGSGFVDNDPGKTLAFLGLKELTDVTIIDDGTLAGLTPPSWIECPKDVRIRNANGEAVLASGFTYTGPIPPIYHLTPRSGPSGGGTLVTIHGDWYTIAGGEMTVVFAEANAGEVTRVNDQVITCRAPPNEPGWVNVQVQNTNGASVLVGGFFYHPRPTVTAITPDEGYFTDNTPVIITGTGFINFSAGENVVMLGSREATQVVSIDDTTIACIAPPRSDLQTVDVRVTNTNGTGQLDRAFHYVAPCWWEIDLGEKQDFSWGDAYVHPELGFLFDFYDTQWPRTHLTGNGNVEFTIGATFDSRILRQWGQVLVMASHLFPCGDNGIYVRQMDDRFIATWDHVPGDWKESITGVGSAQVHLRTNGQICILWKEVTLSWVRVALNPGKDHEIVYVDFSEGVTGAGPKDALVQTFTGGDFDMEYGFLVFDRNDQGGYDATFYDFLP